MIGNITSIARLDTWLTTVIRRVVEKGQRGGYYQRWFVNRYGRMVGTMPKELVGDVSGFLKHW